MKKLIVLTVILGLSTVANAGLVSTDGPVSTGNVSWDVVGGQLVGYNATGVADVAGYWVVMGDAHVTVSAISPLVGDNYEGSLVEDVADQFNAGDLGKVGDGGWGGYDLSGGTGGIYTPIAGDWYVFDLSGDASVSTPGYINVGLYPDLAGEMLTVIPEPATIALLGLGGLLLRRRR